MKEKNNEYGFTLIELLAILVILGVIITIAMASYNIYIEKTNDAYYENLSEILKSAVIDYYSDNPGKLPSNIGDVEKITSDLLLQKNYLESFVDVNKKVCEGTGVSKKEATGKYQYATCIKCPSYNNGEGFGDGCTVTEDEDFANRDYEIIDIAPNRYYQGKDANGNFGNTIIRVPDAEIKADGHTLNITLPASPSTIDTKVPHGTVYTVYYQYQNEYIPKEIEIVDNTKPAPISIVAKYKSTGASYPEGTWTKDNVVLTLTTSDWTIPNELYGSGISKIQISTDRNNWADLEFTESGNVATATATITTDGGFTYYFRALDKSYDPVASDITHFDVYIDKEDPKFVSGYPIAVTNISGYNSTTPIVNIKATDNLSVTDMCVSTTGYCTNWTPYQESINWSSLSKHLDGSSHTFYVSVRDVAGNVAKKTTTYKITSAGLACGTYAKKASVSYAGLNWYALTDNGNTTTLILKTNSHSGQSFGTSTAWSTSNAKTKVTSWFNSNSKLTLEKTTGYAVEDSTYGIVRIPTYNEAVGVTNDSGTPYWTLTASGSNMWYMKKNGGTTYQTYYTSRNGSTCYYGYRKSSISSLKKQSDNIYAGASYSTTASPTSTTNSIDWTFSTEYKPCASHVTDSSGLGPNSGHYGDGPYDDEGPFCADIAPYYGDCGTGSNFCPSKSGSTSSCNKSYTRYSISQNTGSMGLRPVVVVKERCN